MQLASKLVLLLAYSTTFGCRASASIKTGEQDDAPVEEATASSLAEDGLGEGDGDNAVLLGARHDLRLSPDRRTAACTCIAVALGQPNDPAFSWRSIVPVIEPSTQIVIALSSDGVACDKPPADGSPASYWGFKRAGNDVIVVVEGARSGRPVTGGAIISKPGAGGGIYIQPLDQGVVYGRPLNAAEKLCRLGNPGPA